MKSVKLFQLGKGKSLLVAGIIFMWVILGVLFVTVGYEETWELWDVPVEKPFFFDFRLIPGSAESFRNGFEPTVKNPFDPAGRLFNYPTFWRLFFYTGISMDDTLWIVVLMLVLYFAGIVLFPQALSYRDALLMLLVIFSPASMLLYERGNVDLFVFFICALIVFVNGYSANWAAALIVFGAIVKSFPLFGVSVLLKEPKERFWKLTAASILFMVIYGIKTFESQYIAWTTTQRGSDFSYGAFVLMTYLNNHLQSLPLDVCSLGCWKVLFEGLAGILILSGFIGGIVQPHRLNAVSEGNLTAFRMGVSIYLGTFLLGNNWDYRLAFLVFVIPQLSQWLGGKHRLHNLIVLWVLAAIYLSSWYFSIKLDLPLLPIDDPAGRSLVMDEVINWTLLPSFAYLFGASSPDWLRQDFQKILKVVGIKPLETTTYV
ncbi:MAG: hypothetical protein AB1509_02440 [Chloroflexota bacterium]